MLFQLCDQSDSYIYTTHRNGAQSPGDDELVRCLEDLMKLPGQAPIFLFVDALEECPNSSASAGGLVDRSCNVVLPYGRVLIIMWWGNATVQYRGDNDGVLGKGDRWCLGGKAMKSDL